MDKNRYDKLQELLDNLDQIMDYNSQLGRKLLRAIFDFEDPVAGTDFDCSVIDAIENAPDVRSAIKALQTSY